MVLYGGLRSELRNRPIVETSLSLTRVMLFPFLVRSRRAIEFSVSKFEGKPLGVASVAIFHQSIWVVCRPQGNIIV